MQQLLIILLASLILISGCVESNVQVISQEINVVDACKQLCNQYKANGTDLSNGPCLSNKIAEGWVCDVAHSPRAETDNQHANQCPSYGSSAAHFVEVDPDCNFIREY